MRTFRSAWDPLPAGCYTAGMFGGVALVLLVGSVLDDNVAAGIMSLFLGATAIYEACSAAFHAGLRTESYAQELRRMMREESHGDDGPYL